MIIVVKSKKASQKRPTVLVDIIHIVIRDGRW
jgi:hypothetical protein